MRARPRGARRLKTWPRSPRSLRGLSRVSLRALRAEASELLCRPTLHLAQKEPRAPEQEPRGPERSLRPRVKVEVVLVENDLSVADGHPSADAVDQRAAVV
jgi:hypothetical protein